MIDQLMRSWCANFLLKTLEFEEVNKRVPEIILYKIYVCHRYILQNFGKHFTLWGWVIVVDYSAGICCNIFREKIFVFKKTLSSGEAAGGTLSTTKETQAI